MINSVRNTVLSILSKDVRGYVTPEEFNLFSKQAQTEIFEQLNFDYSNAMNKQNAGLHGSGYSDIVEKIGEVLDEFIVTEVLHYNGITTKFYMPGEDPANTQEALSYRLDRLIYNNAIEIDKVDRRKILNLTASNLTAPSTLYPVYTLDNQGIKVYPTTITSNVMVDYLRYPKDPKWTYTSLAGGEALFNQGASDYQDFELPQAYETDLIIKICQYAGVSIREAEVVQAAKSDEVQSKQEKI
jgi:uncharacterized protein YifN (PemK superfamily)